MASTFNLHGLHFPFYYSSTSCSYKPQTLALRPQFPFQSLLKSKNRSMLPIVHTRKCSSRIYAAQFDFFRVFQTAYKVGKEGIEAGTSLVPESVPRPIARISVAVVGATVALFFLKSFLSTAFFVLIVTTTIDIAEGVIEYNSLLRLRIHATMGLIYLAFIAFNKDEGPTGGGGGGGGSTTTTTTSTDEETLEEARRIMEKYK